MRLKISISDFLEAQKILHGYAFLTPLLEIPIKISQGNPLYLKAENLQPSGSFKIRGAYYALSRLSPAKRKRGVVAYSTGNHAIAVALAAQQLNMQAAIVMSPDAMDFKILATTQHGASVIIKPVEERMAYAEEFATQQKAFLLPPFDHRDVIIGQGTIGMEILQAMEPAAVFVCVGGGGLITGIALAIKLQCPHVKIIGVEPLLKIQGTLSLQRRKLIEGEASTTIADAVRIPSLGKLTFPAMMRYVDEMINVSEEQIAEATQLTASSSHLLVEPSGALALAGALAYRGAIAPGKPVVCIASGGNTTIAALNELANRKKRQ